jgi:hypothetical protein
MSGFKSNIQGKLYQRFMDINEPLTMMTPIKGYEQMPIVPLEQAIKPILFIVPEIEHMVHIAKTKCKKIPANDLTIDQSAAIQSECFSGINGLFTAFAHVFAIFKVMKSLSHLELLFVSRKI